MRNASRHSVAHAGQGLCRVRTGACPILVALSCVVPQRVWAQAVTVTDSGTPSYRIPIEVPPGIAGLAPRLALSFSAGCRRDLVG